MTNRSSAPTNRATGDVSSSAENQVPSDMAFAVLSLDPSGGFGLADLVPQFDQILTTASPHYKYANSAALVATDCLKGVRLAKGFFSCGHART